MLRFSLSDRVLNFLKLRIAAAGRRMRLTLHGLGWLSRQTHEAGPVLDNSDLAGKDDQG